MALCPKTTNCIVENLERHVLTLRRKIEVSQSEEREAVRRRLAAESELADCEKAIAVLKANGFGVPDPDFGPCIVNDGPQSWYMDKSGVRHPRAAT